MATPDRLLSLSLLASFASTALATLPAWESLGPGGGDGPGALASSPHDPDIVLVGGRLFVGLCDGTLLRSTDAGETFTEIATQVEDGGNTWRSDLSLAAYSDLSFDAATGRLYVAESWGALYRRDTDRAWRAIPRPGGLLGNPALTTLAGGGTVLASSRHGIFRADTAGDDTWSLSSDGIEGQHILHVGVRPGAPENLLALKWSGLFFSVDAGDSWEALSGGDWSFPTLCRGMAGQRLDRRRGPGPRRWLERGFRRHLGVDPARLVLRELRR